MQEETTQIEKNVTLTIEDCEVLIESLERLDPLQSAKEDTLLLAAKSMLKHPFISKEEALAEAHSELSRLAAKAADKFQAIASLRKKLIDLRKSLKTD